VLRSQMGAVISMPVSYTHLSDKLQRAQIENAE